MWLPLAWLAYPVRHRVHRMSPTSNGYRLNTRLDLILDKRREESRWRRSRHQCNLERVARGANPRTASNRLCDIHVERFCSTVQMVSL